MDSDKDQCKMAVVDEMNSIIQNDTWILVDKATHKATLSRVDNIIDSGWAFKRIYDKDKNVRYKARLVIRSFEDQNSYSYDKLIP